jgi:hypothetical protein
MKKPAAGQGQSASQQISKRIAELGDWRGKTLARMRKLIKEADPGVVEEWKWVKPTNPGTPVWSHDGIICTGESYKSVVKLTFTKGASLEDPARLFNSSLEGNVRRAIDIREGEEVDGSAFKALVRQAAALNGSDKSKPAKPAKSSRGSSGMPREPKPARRTLRSVDEKRAATKPERTSAKKPALLAGGNPQIAKADGDAPVQAYLAAMPGWKSDVGRRLDTLIVRTVPGVRKAVKWNSPFYGVEGQGWFLSLHCFTKYVKVAFFRGALLRPLPPGESKSKETRYLDIHEDDQLDEKRIASWIRQAASIPGWDGGSKGSGGVPL